MRECNGMQFTGSKSHSLRETKKYGDEGEKGSECENQKRNEKRRKEGGRNSTDINETVMTR